MDPLSPRAGAGQIARGEFGERSGDLLAWQRVDTEFVVSAPEILDERVPRDDHLCRPVSARARAWVVTAV